MARAGVQVNLVMLGVQPVPAAAAGRRAHSGGPVALEEVHGVAHRALGLFHRDLLHLASLRCGRQFRRLGASLISLGHSTINLLLTPLTALPPNSPSFPPVYCFQHHALSHRHHHHREPRTWATLWARSRPSVAASLRPGAQLRSPGRSPRTDQVRRPRSDSSVPRWRSLPAGWPPGSTRRR